MDIERYRQEQTTPLDQLTLTYAGERLQRNIENGGHYSEIYDDIALFDRMGRATSTPEPLRTFRVIGQMEDISSNLFQEIEIARRAGNDERVMVLIRVSHLMGHTEDPALIRAANLINLPPKYHPLRRLARFLGQRPLGTVRRNLYDQIFEEHKVLLEQKRQAAASAARNASRASTQADWNAENITGKSIAWEATRRNIEGKWQTAKSGLPVDGSPRSTLTRFEIAFALLHREILQHHPKGYDLQAMIEFLIPEIWAKPNHFDKFISSWRLAIPANVSTVANLDEKTLALFIPEDIKNSTSTLTKAQKGTIRRLQRQYALALHGDRTRANPDANPDLKDQLEEFFKVMNNSWDSVSPLVS